MKVRVFRSRALWALALCLGARAAHATSYTITDLGALGPSGGSNGYALNDSGQVAGVTSVLPGGMHAFLHDGSTMNDLGTLGTGQQSYGFSINASGVVAGSSDTNFPATERRAFYHNGTLHQIGTFGGSVSEARGLNDSGFVVGYATNASGISRAFLYNNGTMIDLGTLGGGSASAAAINNNGRVVGYSATATGQIRAFIAGGPAAMTSLGTLDDYADEPISTAVALNNLSPPQIVGSSTLGSNYHAFLYQSGAMVDLGTLETGGASFASDISDNGDVVGQSQGPGGDRAFLYQNGVMVDLNTLLSANNSAWQLTDASGINNAGQIVGTGINPDGHFHAYLLTPIP